MLIVFVMLGVIVVVVSVVICIYCSRKKHQQPGHVIAAPRQQVRNNVYLEFCNKSLI